MSHLVKALEAANETQRLEIGNGILGKTPDLFKELFGAKHAVIVADERTFLVAGGEVQDEFTRAGIETVSPFIYSEEKLPAEFSYVEKLEESLRSHEAIPVAVGSGTINDLTKLAAHRVGRPYISVATAASMDGYTAFGASITHDGLKQTFTCPAPVAVVADIDVIRRAPGKMNAWGYADLLAKVTAGADWIVADKLGAESIDPDVWEIIQSRLRELVADPKGVQTGDPQSIRHLTEGLLLAGFAMQAAKSSRPASGTEHQFSHLWDMQDHTHEGTAPSHGFKVAIGTLASTALYEALFELPLAEIDVEGAVAKWPSDDSWREKVEEWHGNGDMAKGALREMEAKKVSQDDLREQLSALRENWPELQSRGHLVCRL